MPALLPLLAAYWKPIGLALLIAGALAYRAVLIHERDSARAQVATLTAETSALQSAEAACETAVARQNAAVSSLKAAADRAVAAANTRVAGVAAAAEAADAADDARAVQLEHAPVAADCPAAIKWANAQVGELGKW